MSAKLDQLIHFFRELSDDGPECSVHNGICCEFDEWVGYDEHLVPTAVEENLLPVFWVMWDTTTGMGNTDQYSLNRAKEIGWFCITPSFTIPDPDSLLDSVSIFTNKDLWDHFIFPDDERNEYARLRRETADEIADWLEEWYFEIEQCIEEAENE